MQAIRHRHGHLIALLAANSITAWTAAQTPQELLPTSQYARLGYHNFGRALAANAGVVLSAGVVDYLSNIYEDFDAYGDYVEAFRLQDGTWMNEAALVPINCDDCQLNGDYGEYSDKFGYAVAVSPSGQVAIVGAPGYDGPNGYDSGDAFVYVARGTGWMQVQRLHFGFVTYEYFGAAVDIGLGDNGYLAVVGAPAGGFNGRVGAGAAYIYPSECSVYCFEQKLEAPPGAANFGMSVATDGDSVIVGAQRASREDDPTYRRGGAVFVYERQETTPTTWELTQTLYPDLTPSTVNNAFGSVISLGGPNQDVLAVSNAYETVRGVGFAGSVYLFRKVHGAWQFEQRLLAPPQSSVHGYSSGFGQSIALSDQILVVGADWPYEEYSDLGPGSVHAYRFDGSGWFRALYSLTPDNPYGGEYFGKAVAATGSIAFVGAAGYPGLSNELGKVFTFQVPALGDLNADGHVNGQDAAEFVACLGGPDRENLSCAKADFDVDLDIDLADIAVLFRAFGSN